MPIYEYRCTKGHVFDRMQRFSDDPLSKCEVCGASAQRVMHAPAVHFKGSGFYNTDYGRKKGGGNGSTEGGGESKGSASGGSEGSDSKSKDSGSADSTPATGGEKAKASSSSE
jgi:putative FmdB family regulatory protein